MKFIINKEGTAGVGAGTLYIVLDKPKFITLSDAFYNPTLQILCKEDQIGLFLHC